MPGWNSSQLPAEEIIDTFTAECGRKPSDVGAYTILAGYLGLAVYVAASVAGPAVDAIAEVDLTALLPGGPPNRTLESVHSTVALAEQINAIPRIVGSEC